MEKQAAFEKIAQVRAKLMLRGAYEAGVRDGMEKLALAPVLATPTVIAGLRAGTRAATPWGVLGSKLGAPAAAAAGGAVKREGADARARVQAADKNMFDFLNTRSQDTTRTPDQRVQDYDALKRGPTDVNSIPAPSYWQSFKKTYGLGQ